MEELPEGFQHIVVERMQDQGAEADAVMLAVVQYQVSLTSWAGSIYDFTQMKEVHNRCIAVFLPEMNRVYSLSSILNRRSTGRDITQYVLGGDKQNWNFVSIEPEDSHLDVDTQYLGVRQASRVSAFEQDALCLIAIHFDHGGRGTTTFQAVEFRSRFFPLVMDELEMLFLPDLMEICNIEECIGMIDGNCIQRGETFNVNEGSFLKVGIGPHDQQQSPHETEIAMDIDEQVIGCNKENKVHYDSSMHDQGDQGGQHHRLTGGLTNMMLPTVLHQFLPKHTSHGIAMPSTLFLLVSAIQVPVQRVGEGQHPGPDVWIGTTNPSGLRGREESYYQLPQGVWCVSETQLTGINQRDVSMKVSRLNRHDLQVPHGAPVMPRSASSMSGTWAGVMALADLICRPVGIHWKHSEYALGRAQVFQAWCDPFAVAVLLEELTRELVLSRTGPRFIAGDYNCAVDDSPSIGKSQGWVDIRSWAWNHHGHPATATSKHTNILDYICVSPELLQYIQEVRTWELFADHTALGARFSLLVASATHAVWPANACLYTI